jgi:hypothetical protein
VEKSQHLIHGLAGTFHPLFSAFRRIALLIADTLHYSDFRTLAIHLK